MPTGWYGSVINRIEEDITPKAVEVGLPCTILHWSDRSAYTVIAVSKSGKEATIRRVKAVRTDKNGMSECQQYEYIEDLQGATRLISLRKDGRWHEGTTLKGEVVLMGKHDEYYDYSF